MQDVAEYRGSDRNSTSSLVLDSESLDKMMKLAEIMQTGVATVPKHLQKNPADCLAVIMQAMQWKMNPYAVAQKTHLVNGTLGYEAQLVNAVITSSNAIEGRFHYEYQGDWKGVGGEKDMVRVGAVLKGETLIQWGEWLSPASVTTKNSPLWKTNPKQQTAYLALKMWSRLYCPAVVLGVYTPDELEELPEDRMPPLQSGRQEIEMYSDEQFKKFFPAWKKAIESGKKTAEDVIATVSAKAMLSEDQKKQIRDIKIIATNETVQQESTEEQGEQQHDHA